jgi:hypothetical protein
MTKAGRRAGKNVARASRKLRADPASKAEIGSCTVARNSGSNDPGCADRRVSKSHGCNQPSIHQRNWCTPRLGQTRRSDMSPQRFCDPSPVDRDIARHTGGTKGLHRLCTIVICRAHGIEGPHNACLVGFGVGQRTLQLWSRTSNIIAYREMLGWPISPATAVSGMRCPQSG